MSNRTQNIVVGQPVRHDKVEWARQMRQEPTAEETLLWEKLRRNQIGGLRFRRQQVIDGYIADFYCHAAGLVVEVDGPIHKASSQEDSYRDEVLASRGLRVLRVTNEQVRTDIQSILLRILRATETPLLASGRGRGRGLSDHPLPVSGRGRGRGP